MSAYLYVVTTVMSAYLILSAVLCDVCLLVRRLFTRTSSAYLYDAGLLIQYYVCLPYDVCLPVLCLYLYYVCLPIFCLATCILDVWQDVLLPVCLPTCVLSAFLYDVCSVWRPHSCMISSYLYDVCSTVSCLPTCLMFAQLYDVCLPVWCLLYCTVWCLPTFTHDVCLCVLCLPTYMFSS